MKRLFTLLVIVVGCSTSPAATHQVELDTFNFQPDSLSIRVGDTVAWLNQDRIHHTVTAGTSESETGLFDIDLFDQGEVGEFTFEQAGQYQYFCVIHPHMQGSIEVVDP